MTETIRDRAAVLLDDLNAIRDASSDPEPLAPAVRALVEVVGELAHLSDDQVREPLEPAAPQSIGPTPSAVLDTVPPMTDAALLAEIAETLWPGGDPDAEWDAETIDAVAGLIHKHRPELIPSELNQ